MVQAQASREMKLMQNSIAMTVCLISFAMLFATMFLGYFLVRFNSPVWPPVEIENIPQLLPLLSTLVMALSSVAYYLFEKKAQARKIYWSLTFLLGMSFLFLQCNLWHELNTRGILTSDGMVTSMVYAFTWLHAAHIALGLMALLWTGYYAFVKTASLTEILVMNVGKFWHFLGVIWLLVYLTLFVL
jgi:cytochrome c oxidase subunit III